MTLIRSVKETVKGRADRDAAFRAALLSEPVELLPVGELETAEAMLRDYFKPSQKSQ